MEFLDIIACKKIGLKMLENVYTNLLRSLNENAHFRPTKTEFSARLANELDSKYLRVYAP